MILGIDASNIRAGGGLTHLVELLQSANPLHYGFEKVVIWGGESTLSKIKECSWIQKTHILSLDRNILHRIYWQRFSLKKLANQAGCSLLFVPGGSDSSKFSPLVTMSQNLLPFEWQEIKKYGFSFMAFKLLVLRFTQSKTFSKAEGVIFLTQYAQNQVLKVTNNIPGKTSIISHGINQRFFMPPRIQRQHHEFNNKQPCRVTYVSTIDVYKHQQEVCQAIANLRTQGIPIVLDLIGDCNTKEKHLKSVIQKIDPDNVFINYYGHIPYEKLHEFYHSTDIAVFASSCETFGQILTEKMSAGLPIACSNRSAMPEILGESGVYFDPESPDEIANAILTLMCSAELRHKLATLAYQKSQSYSWKRCSEETFEFLSSVINHE